MVDRNESAPGSKPSLKNPGSAEPRGSFCFSPDSSSDLLYHISPIITAVMVDAEFYLKRGVKRMKQALSAWTSSPLGNADKAVQHPIIAPVGG